MVLRFFFGSLESSESQRATMPPQCPTYIIPVFFRTFGSGKRSSSAYFFAVRQSMSNSLAMWLIDLSWLFRRFLIVLISVIASIPFLTSSYSVGTITLEEFQDARNGFFFCPKLLAELCTFALQLYVGLSCHKQHEELLINNQLYTKLYSSQ